MSLNMTFLVLLVLLSVASSSLGSHSTYRRATRQTSGTTSVNSDTSKGCTLPEQPKNGAYISPLCEPGDQRSVCINTPGTPVPNYWPLKYSCDANYSLTSEDSKYSICDNQTWHNPLDCYKLCPPLISSSVDTSCTYNGSEVQCNKPMKPNTRVTVKCKQHYREVSQHEYSSLVCQDNGEWSSKLFNCAPDCGYVTGSEELLPLILNGSPTRQGEFPWVAALYLKDKDDRWEQQCGGTLISPHIVLTAAHCVVREDGVIASEDIRIGLGKQYRDYYKTESFSVTSDVREIVVSRLYSGRASFFAFDIAIIDLKRNIHVTAYIMPACVDWLSSIYVSPGTLGQIAGWGVTENGTSIEKLQSTKLSLMDNSACINNVRAAYKRIVSVDKFCGTSSNGGEVSRGDGGSGLTISNNGQHFIRGVLSTKIASESQISFVTNISFPEHHSWLEEQTNRLGRLHDES